MNNTALTAANLPTFSFDQLGTAYTIAAARALAADRQSVACSRAMALRERVANEASRRGAVIRKMADGGYACGRSADFNPMEAR